MSGRKLGLLILILGFGASVETAWSVRNHLDVGPAGCRVLGGKFYGASYRFESEVVRPLAPGARLEVVNSFGAVRVHPGKPGELRVVLTKVVFLPTEPSARDFASRMELRAQEEGPVLRVSTNRDDLTRGRDDVGFETHVVVEAPAGTPVVVRNEHGEVDLQEVGSAEVEASFDGVRVERAAGDVKVRNRHGDVTVSGIGGSLFVSDRYGNVDVKDVAGKTTADVEHGDLAVAGAGGLDAVLAFGNLNVSAVKGDLVVHGQHAAVQAAEVTGSASVTSTFDSVSVSSVGGDVRLNTQHGEISARDVKGALTADATFDGVKLERIGGPVTVHVEHGGLEGTAIEKGVKVKASGDSVNLETVRGPIEIEVDRGSVHLDPRNAIVERLSVTVSHGGIRLDVPPASRFDVEAESRQGEIEVDVPGLTATETSQRVFKGRLGDGGPPMRLSAQGGDITLRASVATASKED